MMVRGSPPEQPRRSTTARGDKHSALSAEAQHAKTGDAPASPFSAWRENAPEPGTPSYTLYEAKRESDALATWA